MSVSDIRQPVPPFTETRSPVPLLYRRHSSGEIRNLASISSSLLPAFGTVMGEGSINLKKFVIAPYDRRYRKMGDRLISCLMDDLPLHLILEILSSGRLGALDLVCLELTSRTFGANHGLFTQKFRSLVDFAAFRLCGSHPIYSSLQINSRNELFDRCNGNWKRMLRFLQSVEQSCDMVQTSAGNMQIKSGRYHTLLINNSDVYSCGSSLCGVLGHGPETTQCVAFSRISFPSPAPVIQLSASHNHAAFVTQSGEVFTCGDNSSFCCGHRDTGRPIFRPRLVEALKGIPCKQVAAGLSFTMFLTRQGRVYTCGINTHGQLGHGDTVDRPEPKNVERLDCVASVVQIAAGPSYALAVADDGTLFSFGSGTNFCLGHGEQHNEFLPRAIQSFKRKGIHVVRVSAGDEHAVALDSNGYVYTWGKGYCGALGHGDEIDKTTPELLSSLRSLPCCAVFVKPPINTMSYPLQVCASKRKTFVLVDDGSVYGFGWMGFGSLGFTDRGVSDKILRPRVLDSLRPYHISQISTGLYHTVVVTNQGRVFGFGDNERAQLGHDTLRGCLEPTEIIFGEMCSSPPHPTLPLKIIGKTVPKAKSLHSYQSKKLSLLSTTTTSDVGMDFYNVNLVDGYNVSMLVVPQGGSGANCTTTGCASDLNGACPSDLWVTSSDGEDVLVLGFWEGAVLLQRRVHHARCLQAVVVFSGVQERMSTCIQLRL
ncbi:Regulator of chromosome condensation (RCC1) family protein [Abeliophyllum distichum]|uniref:Regulator of chromosome condensation (RCC1) family protein n=1 Tax=Abeliophyllum distichum TaxID=126358 RepID=A0ABD1QIP2_9LAMI